MHHRTVQPDLRDEKRLKARYGALASFFPPGPDFTLLIGKIIDISPKGVAILYYERNRPLNISKHVEVFGIHHPLMHVERLPGNIVYDFEVNSPTRSALKLRRCGVEFGKLSVLKRSQLDHFIREYAYNMDRPSPRRQDPDILPGLDEVS